MKLQKSGWFRRIDIDDVDLKHVIFCSEFRHRQHVEQGLPLGDFRVVYNGIDVDRFDARRRPAGDRLRVMFCGRLVPDKGAHTAIEAMKEVVAGGCRSINLTIVGGPSHPWEYSERLREMVAANRLEEYVEFAGAVSNDRIAEVYGRHDVLVFTSICDEGLPVTMLEAMACGLTVIGTTTGGSSEILREGVTGLTFTPGNGAELAERLIQVAAEPDHAKRLGIAGRKFVLESFGIEEVCDQTEDYLRTVALN
jgi:glycosyltransferase involved in cell wall biosynthesis